MATISKAESADHLGSAMLEQLAAIEVRSLSPDTARTFLELGFSTTHQKRLDDLSAKASQGVLTPEESRELDEAIHIGHLVAILHSKARQAIKRAGKTA